MSEERLVTELEKPTGFVFRVWENDDGVQRREMEDTSGRKLEWIAGIFFDRQNHVCYRGDSGDLCQVSGGNRHVWEFEDARLQVDYKDKEGNPVRGTQLLNPTGFLTRRSCQYLAAWLETNFPEHDYFISPGSFAQTGSFQRYPQNQLYIVVVRKNAGGTIEIKRINAGLLVSNTFLRYDESQAVSFCSSMLSGAWDVSLSEVDPDILSAAPAAPLPSAPVAPAQPLPVVAADAVPDGKKKKQK